MRFENIDLTEKLNSDVMIGTAKIIEDLDIQVVGSSSHTPLLITNAQRDITIRPQKGSVEYRAFAYINNARYDLLFKDGHLILSDAVNRFDSSLRFHFYTHP